MNRVFQAMQQNWDDEQQVPSSPIENSGPVEQVPVISPSPTIEWSPEGTEKSEAELVLGALGQDNTAATTAYHPAEGAESVPAFPPVNPNQQLIDELQHASSPPSEPQIATPVEGPAKAPETTSYDAPADQVQSTADAQPTSNELESPAGPANHSIEVEPQKHQSGPAILETLADQSQHPLESQASAEDSVAAPRELELMINHRFEKTPHLTDYYEALMASVMIHRRTNQLALCFTSAEVSIETSVLVFTLAKMLSERAGEEVLVVDGAIRSHVMSQQMQMTEGPGVLDFLEMGALERDWIATLSTPLVHFLPAGTRKLGIEPNCSRLFELVPLLNQSFCTVLIDAGSEMDAVYDTWAQACNSTYLAVQLGKTEVEVAHRVAETIQRTGAGFSGSIVCQ